MSIVVKSLLLSCAAVCVYGRHRLGDYSTTAHPREMVRECGAFKFRSTDISNVRQEISFEWKGLEDTDDTKYEVLCSLWPFGFSTENIFHCEKVGQKNLINREFKVEYQLSEASYYCAVVKIKDGQQVIRTHTVNIETPMSWKTAMWYATPVIVIVGLVLLIALGCCINWVVWCRKNNLPIKWSSLKVRVPPKPPSGNPKASGHVYVIMANGEVRLVSTFPPPRHELYPDEKEDTTDSVKTSISDTDDLPPEKSEENETRVQMEEPPPYELPTTQL